MLNFSSRVIPTISVFFRHKNKIDIDIFVEDYEDEEFYNTLFTNLLGKEIQRVNCVGCKTKVIEACENDQKPRKRKRIYIVDGDLDLIVDSNRKDLKHLFVLDKYCIENYLLEEDCIIEFLHETVVLEKEKISRAINFQSFLKTLSHPLINLFLHYALAHRHGIGVKTVSNSVFNYCIQRANINVLDETKITNEINSLRTHIETVITQEKYYEEIYNLRQRWTSNVENLISIVSCKDYILPLLESRFKKLKGKANYNVTRESLRVRLAKKCNLNSLKELRQIILEQ